MKSRSLKITVLATCVVLLSVMAVTGFGCRGGRSTTTTPKPTVTTTNPTTTQPTTTKPTTTKPTTTPPKTTLPTTTPPSSSPLASLPEKVTIDLKADDLKFSVNSLIVAAGADVTIQFHNDDSGVTHNFAIYTDSSAATKIFQGTNINGPGTIAYKFKAPQKGNYYFRSDLHPSMNGSFVTQ